jgi:hypothetical protein
MRSRRGLSEKALSSNALSVGLGVDGGEFGVSAEAGVVGRQSCIRYHAYMELCDIRMP